MTDISITKMKECLSTVPTLEVGQGVMGGMKEEAAFHSPFPSANRVARAISSWKNLSDILTFLSLEEIRK